MDLINSYSPIRRLRNLSGLGLLLREVIFRTRDILFAFFGLILLSPIFGVIALLIKRDTPGPVFFRGKRAAKGGGTFRILKFRTMYEDARSYDGPKVTGSGDVRITSLGGWLRDTKLNELPQLWNVLVGEMSLVGPRPEDPDIVAKWPEDIRNEILSVRPGITSPASVLHRDEEAILTHDKVMEQYFEMVAPSKMRLDQLYVHHRSLLLDLDVFFWTLLVLLPRLSSFKPPEKLLFFGPVAKLATRYANWWVIDFLISFAAFGVSGVFWRSLGPIHLGIFVAVGVSLAFSLLFSLIGALFGIQKTVWSTASANEVIDLAATTGFAGMFALLINHNKIMPNQIIILASLLAFLGFSIVRYRSRLLSGLSNRLNLHSRVATRFREKVLIVGSGKAGELAAWLLHNGPKENRYQVVGYIDDDYLKHDTRMRGIRVVGESGEIPEIVMEQDIGLILFAIHNINSLRREKIMKLCNQTQAKVVVVPDMFGAIEGLMQEKLSREDEQSAAPPIFEAPSQAYLSDLFLDLEENIKNGDLDSSLERVQQLRGYVIDGRS